jgi:hypothetical protein
MKKFGKKTNNFGSYNEEIINDYPGNFINDITNENYEKEMSKKLKLSNKEEKIKVDNFKNVIFKTTNNINWNDASAIGNNKTTLNSYASKSVSGLQLKVNPNLNLNSGIYMPITQETIISECDENIFNPKPASKKIKRLSELEQTNLYFILQIEENASEEAVKKAYKNLCRVHHPDKGGNSEVFNKINKAYQILRNDTCRKLYDKFSIQSMEIIEYILSLGDEVNSHLELNLDFLVFSNTFNLEMLKIIINGGNK